MNCIGDEANRHRPIPHPLDSGAIKRKGTAVVYSIKLQQSIFCVNLGCLGICNRYCNKKADKKDDSGSQDCFFHSYFLIRVQI